MPEPVDPERVLSLLWRAEEAPPPSGRGPRRGLDVDVVVTAATARADAAGPAGAEGLTMRALAADLGVAAMTLYTYVPNRDVLVDLMLDAAYAAMPRADTSGRDWRARLTAVAEENRALHHTHPWTVRTDPARPTLGPGETVKYERELAALDDLAAAAGLDDVDRDAALTFLLDVVRSTARAELESTSGDLTAWWAARGPALARRLDPARFPRAMRVGQAAGEAAGGVRDPDRVWDFALARVLDGLGALAS